MSASLALLLANLMAAFHMAWMAYLLVGTLLAVFGVLHKYRKAIIVYGLMVAGTGFSNGLTGSCLFTNIEKHFRSLAGADYAGSFSVHYLSQFNINISGEASFFILNGMFLLGLTSALFWMMRARIRGKEDIRHGWVFPTALKMTALAIMTLIVTLIPQFNTHAGGGGGGGGGIDCTGLIDLTAELVDTEIISKIPGDPQGETDDSSGYLISVDGNGTVTVSAPSAELGETISTTN